MPDLINEDTLTELVKKIVIEVIDDNRQDDLTGRTIKMPEFCHKFCGGKSPEWVRTKIFDRYPEVNYTNGGWVVNPRRRGHRSTIIFAKEASKWLDKHQHEIDWNEKL